MNYPAPKTMYCFMCGKKTRSKGKNVGHKCWNLYHKDKRYGSGGIGLSRNG